MNEHLKERFGRRARPSPTGDRVDVWMLPPKLNPRILEYYRPSDVQGSPWLLKPEFPSSAEVTDAPDDDQDSHASSDIVELEANRPRGAWHSKEEYLQTQYELYREDALRGIREAVTTIKSSPHAVEDDLGGRTGIYEKVHICGLLTSTRGIAVHVTFSTRRAGKQILWEQSNRLISGSVVVLSPSKDLFKNKASIIVATVAARPAEKVKLNPPEIDLFFVRPEELQIDPAQEFTMIEDRGGLFEANRYILLGLQRMMREPFPLAQHLVSVQSDVRPPKYVEERPYIDLSSVFENENGKWDNVSILEQWPANPPSQLDTSQVAALQRILTKQLAIIQGPPGTGKTHVSVQAIKVMLANHRHGDPPIIIACQTNHAIDQFLRHVAQFESEFCRLGGRSKDRDVIKKRTLYELQMQSSESPPAGSAYRGSNRTMADVRKKIAVLLAPLAPCEKPMDHVLLVQMKILTPAQANSLQLGASRWVQAGISNPNEARSPFKVWLGDKLVAVPLKQEPEEYGFAFEEADLEFERLKEEEAENITKDDEDFDQLHGACCDLADNFTCWNAPEMDSRARKMLEEQDLWKIPEVGRGAVYRYLQSQLKERVLEDVRKEAKKYDQLARQRRVGQYENWEPILKAQKVIGMTTTGLSKYRGLLSALQPKVVLIEEAAETLEAPVTVACMPSVQHLILVGDHLQLRPHTHSNAYEDHPWHLNVSLFERMINNEVEYSTLNEQRRMIPEIRRILYPIYKDIIKDHPSVMDPSNRPDVPGMGVNSFFFTHGWHEDRDDLMSCYNDGEAKMIAGFVEYLIFNGMTEDEITILTFYHGQRKKILSQLRSRYRLQDRRFQVATVDSYQGEENKVVILSLVRSNEKQQIGFLSVENRVCVALSRAQCGFYIFGNGMLLHTTESLYAKPKKIKNVAEDLSVPKVKNKVWTQVITIMAGRGKNKDYIPPNQPIRLAEVFTVRCKNHGCDVKIESPPDWDNIIGGCLKQCEERLPCGHVCSLTCHPFPHDQVLCVICPRGRVASFPEDEYAGDIQDVSNKAKKTKTDHTGTNPSLSASSSWSSFAAAEPKRLQDSVGSLVPAAQRMDPTHLSLDFRNVSLSDRGGAQVGSRGSKGKQKAGPSLESAVSSSSSSNGTSVGDGSRRKWKDKVSIKETVPSTEEASSEPHEENLIDLGF